jgi:hypothetical protein
MVLEKAGAQPAALFVAQPVELNITLKYWRCFQAA